MKNYGLEHKRSFEESSGCLSSKKNEEILEEQNQIFEIIKKKV
jgi:hypothetical protein